MYSTYRLGELFPTEPMRPKSRLFHLQENVWLCLDKQHNQIAMILDIKKFINKWICE